MKTLIFSTTILLASIANGYVDDYHLIHFSKSKEELLKCLKNTELSIVLNSSVDNAQPKLNSFKLLSHLFYEQTVAAGSIDVLAGNLANSLGASMLNFDEDQIEQIKKAIVKALHKCSDPKDPTSKIKPGVITPPRFIQEIPEIAELLNMILVTWIPDSPNPTKADYLTLSQFSRRSLSLIEVALRRMNNAHELFAELWSMWNRRARLFFNVRTYPQYLLSFFKSNRIIVHTDLVSDVFNRLFNNTSDHPSFYTPDGFFEMTRYRELDWYNPMNSSVFSVPTPVSLTESQYYFKRQLHRFFQILFAYLESIERGFNQNSETYEWEAFKKELPLLQSPFNDGYEAYLGNVQRRELSHEFARNSSIFSSLVRSLEPGDQIDEFDLLTMVWHRLRPVDVDTRTTATTKTWYKSFKYQLSRIFKAGLSKSRNTTATTDNTTATPFFTDSSSTSDYDESKKGKGPFTKLSSGKYIPKKQRGSDENSNNHPSTSNEHKYYQNSNDMGKKYCKFSADPYNSEHSAIFMTLLKSLIHLESGLSCY